jgi:hypothetical protein
VTDEHDTDDPDRAAILARRRRFVALAISGLAATSCKGYGPQACLSIEVPQEPDPEAEPESDSAGPVVEDPGVPVESGETGGEEPGESGEAIESTPPQVCLKVAPQPCLRKG